LIGLCKFKDEVDDSLSERVYVQIQTENFFKVLWIFLRVQNRNILRWTTKAQEVLRLNEYKSQHIKAPKHYNNTITTRKE